LDGAGYPQGLQGANIPLMARIVAIADSFDALTHDRPYNRSRSVKEAIAEIQRERGRQFDPEIVDAFMRVYDWESGRGQRDAKAREDKEEEQVLWPLSPRWWSAAWAPQAHSPQATRPETAATRSSRSAPMDQQPLHWSERAKIGLPPLAPSSLAPPQNKLPGAKRRGLSRKSALRIVIGLVVAFA